MNMHYEKTLRLALVPTIVFFLLSLVSVALTTHYWILGDWIVPRGVRVVTDDYNDRTQSYRTDFTIVYFIDKETDATIASGCLCLSASIFALIAWSTLRKPGMDTQPAAGKRRFWVLAVIVMTITSAAAALGSLVLHYAQMGDDDFGCKSETLMMTGKLNTNKQCTREMAACNFLPEYLKGGDRSNAAIACNETVVVKWLQLILVVNALVVFAIFALQARVRRKTRDTRMMEPLPKVA
ncbi:hypothetical protein BDU57DRAFT_584947 [Ampelomyces quisqualis]|uniref:Uncharacterized protein n=1 Tax=Ampelomyces quisqualis TaxID=50730 RepID=A0A6A5R2X5_AMPQU|nr:hypothetical protein BDU57DRAFT_584947 [Ampelomyces quisqualis]